MTAWSEAFECAIVMPWLAAVTQLHLRSLVQERCKGQYVRVLTATAPILLASDVNSSRRVSGL